jgi:hypothetical protein
MIIEHLQQDVARNYHAMSQQITFYIGPDIPTYGLRHKCSFVGALGSMIQAATEKYPVIKDLFVDMKDFPAALQALKDPASTESILYAEAHKSIAY